MTVLVVPAPVSRPCVRALPAAAPEAPPVVRLSPTVVPAAVAVRVPASRVLVLP